MSDMIRLSPIPKYVSIAQTSFQQAIAYRVTTLFNIGLTFIWVFILYYLWSAVYANRTRIEGFTWDDMRTYIVLAYGLNALVGWRIGANMMYTIRTGEILRDLTRPLNYCGTQLAAATGASIVEGVISLLLTLVIGMFLLDIRAPDSPAAAGIVRDCPHLRLYDEGADRFLRLAPHLLDAQRRRRVVVPRSDHRDPFWHAHPDRPHAGLAPHHRRVVPDARHRLHSAHALSRESHRKRRGRPPCPPGSVGHRAMVLRELGVAARV